MLVFRQAIIFLIISGTGWIIDLMFYSFLIYAVGLNVFAANTISCIPAIMFVFFTSTIKVFINSHSRLKLWQKLILYYLYQFILIMLISSLAQFVYAWITTNETLLNYAIVIQNAEVIAKIGITPITMTINFLVMKFIIEKI